MSNGEYDMSITILSIGHAHTLATLASATHNYNLVKEIGEIVLTDGSLSGEAKDFHNLAVQFALLDDYATGYGVVRLGLKRFPYNVDLLSDAVCYGSACGEYEGCDECISVLMSRPYSSWNWRAFTFVSDYFIDRADWTQDPKEILSGYEEALKLSRKQQEVLADEEKGYLREFQIRKLIARLYGLKGEKDTEQREIQLGEEALQRAIASDAMAATGCCLAYADYLFERQHYKEVIKYCNRTFEFGESQSTVNLGYVLYLCAQSKDVLIHREDAFADLARVEEAFSDYAAAWMCGVAESHKSTIRTRCAVLATKSGVDAPDMIMNDGE